MKNVLHLLVGGGTGGIEVLCRDYALYSKHNNIFVILWFPGAISDEMKNRGDTIIELNIHKIKCLKTIKELNKIVEQYRIDTFIVHHASPILHIYMMIFKYKYKSITTIAYAHSMAKAMYRSDEKRGAFLRKEILRQSLKKADYVVAVSNAVKDSLLEVFKISKSHIEVIYNGVDTRRFVAKYISDTDHTLKLIYVGRLIKNKGLQTILYAMSMYEKDAKIHLAIVGDGNYRQALQELSKELKIEHKVEFLGNRNNVSEMLAEADVFLHVPLLEEGFGIAVIEAMACGLICICSRSGALPEIINDKRNGFLVNKDDAAGIYKCLKFITESSQENLHSIKEYKAREEEL